MGERPIDPMGRHTVEEYLAYVELVPAAVRERVHPDVDPRTGERTSFRLNNHVLFAELYLLTERLGSPPDRVDMTRFGAFYVGVYEDRFGEFTVAVELAGLEPNFHSPEERMRRDAFDADSLFLQPTDGADSPDDEGNGWKTRKKGARSERAATLRREFLRRRGDRSGRRGGGG